MLSYLSGLPSEGSIAKNMLAGLFIEAYLLVLSVNVFMSNAFVRQLKRSLLNCMVVQYDVDVVLFGLSEVINSKNFDFGSLPFIDRVEVDSTFDFIASPTAQRRLGYIEHKPMGFVVQKKGKLLCVFGSAMIGRRLQDGTEERIESVDDNREIQQEKATSHGFLLAFLRSVWLRYMTIKDGYTGIQFLDPQDALVSCLPSLTMSAANEGQVAFNVATDVDRTDEGDDWNSDGANGLDKVERMGAT